jgi:endonuclease-8
VPEGDSLHRAAAALRVLQGARVTAESPHPRGALTGVAAAVDGRVLESVEAVGKNLLLRFEGGRTVRSHLRMTGRWRVRRSGAAPFRGRPWLVLRAGGWEAVQWNGPVLELVPGTGRRLRQAPGPDVIAAAGTEPLVAALRRADGRRLLGELLLDQRVVSGIGNVWMAEGLWRARLSPWLPAAEATDAELTVLLGWLSASMRGAVAGARPARAVYRRAGRGCRRCGAILRSRGLGDANRTAYWCAACQRGPSQTP